MKNCYEIRDMLSFYLDNELHENERKQVVKHLEVCGECKAELEQLKNIIELTGDIEEVELPQNYSQQLHEKLVKESSLINPEKKAVKFGVYRWGTLAAAFTILFIGISTSYFEQFGKKTESQIAFVQDARLETVDRMAMDNLNDESQNMKAAFDNAENKVAVQTEEKGKNVVTEEKETQNIQAASKTITPDVTQNPVPESNGSGQEISANTALSPVQPAEQPQTEAAEQQPQITILADVSQQSENSDASMSAMRTAPKSSAVSEPQNIEQQKIVLNVSDILEAVEKVSEIVKQNGGKIEEIQMLRTFSHTSENSQRNFKLEIPQSLYPQFAQDVSKLGVASEVEQQGIQEKAIESAKAEDGQSNSSITIKLDINQIQN